MAVLGEDGLRAENDRLRAELAAQRERSGDEQRARAEELHDSYVATVRALTNAVEARDAYTGKHAERVAAYGLLLTRRIDSALADDPQTEFGFGCCANAGSASRSRLTDGRDTRASLAKSRRE